MLAWLRRARKPLSVAKMIFHIAVIGLALLGVVLLRPDLAEQVIEAVSKKAIAQTPVATKNLRTSSRLSTGSRADSPRSRQPFPFAAQQASTGARNTSSNRLLGAGAILGSSSKPTAVNSLGTPGARDLAEGANPAASAPLTKLDSLVRPVADTSGVKEDLDAVARNFLNSPPTGNPILDKKIDPLALRSGLPEPQLIEETRIIGRVGGEVILAGDVMRQIQSIEEQLQANIFRLSPAEVTKQRHTAMREALAPLIESKLRFVAAKRGMEPKQYTEVVKNIEKHFQDERVKFFMEKTGARNYVELEAKIKEQGADLKQIRRDFVEQLLGREWQKKEIGELDEPPHADLLAYYETHASEYEHAAQVLWRQISVTFPAGATVEEKKQAWSKIANAGNRIRGINGQLQPEKFENVAREVSTGPTASEGGAWDWTRQGSLASKTLEAAIFSIPVGELSRIIEDGNSFHIVQVTDKREAGKTPFAEAQQAIHDKLMEEKRHEAEARYMAKLRAEIPVFTIYDKDE